MNLNIERLVIGGGALVLGLLAGWMIRGVATYNTASESSTVYNDWRVFCPQAQMENVSCEISGDIVDPELKATIARISIAKDFRNKENPDGEVIAYTLPPNVLLPNGVGVQVGKEPVKTVKYRSCNQQGCVAITPLDDTMINAMRAGTDTKISFIGAQPNAKAQTLTVSYNGFNAARRAYERGNSKRTSWFWRLWS
jgi:invasion protein IalB